MLRDMVESVMLEKEDVLDIGGRRCLRRRGRRLRWALDTLLCSVVVVILEVTSSSDSKQLVVSSSELNIDELSYP